MAKNKKSSGGGAYWSKPDFTKIIITDENYRINLQKALAYAHTELSSVELKRDVIKWIKTLDPKHSLLDKIKDINENKFNFIGKYAFILVNGGHIPEDIMPILLPTIEKIIKEEENKNTLSKIKVEKEEKSVISIQDKLRDRAKEIAGEIEGWLDNFCIDKKSAIKEVEDFVNLFKANDIKSVHTRHFLGIFEERSKEIEEVIEGKDKLLLEGYSNFTKPEIKKLDQFYKNLFKACEMLQEVAKVTRAPRKRKPISFEKVVSKLKFKKDDTSLGIVSLNPIQIIGAKEIWIYNTKTRKLAQYKAIDIDGIGVKGASLVGFSSDSKEKTLRKPAETLSEFKKASKIKLRTFLDELSTLDVPCGGKLNEHCVILRVDK